MKKFLTILVVCMLVLTMFAGCTGTATPPDDDGQGTEPPPPVEDNDLPVVRIGVYEPQSGDNGAGGKQEILGMQYANYETPTVVIAGTTYEVELVYADNQSANDKAVSAAQTLIAAGCPIVLGSYGSGVSIAASDTFGDVPIPVIGVTCTNPAVTLGNDHYFRICFLDPFQGPVLAQFAKDKFSASKAYCLSKLGDDYSVGLCNFFAEAFGKENCRMESFPEGTSDYSTYVANAKAYGADVFFSPVSTEAAALIIDQVDAQGLGTPLLAGDTWDSNVILNAAKGKDIELFVTTFYQEGGAPAFDNGIKAWINSNPTAKQNNGGDDMIAAVSAMGYDAYYTALEAFKVAGSVEAGDILAILPALTYKGVSGNIAFDDVGDAKRDTAFVKVCNTATGEWDFVKEQGID
ncbi:MAG: ABC transporter substrate-binding protein [Clostridiales bacterium]|nr:ABC transporter substrate-binding protein [Clostridiales bacterium]